MRLNSVPGMIATVAVFFFPSLPSFAQSELIVNGGFESVFTGWNFDGGAGVGNTSGFARSGSNFLLLGAAASEVDSSYQTIDLPSTATSATLSFYYNILSDDDHVIPHDLFSATIRNTNGTILATVGNWSNANQDSGIGPANYHQKTFNLLPYPGQTIQIQFNSSNDSSQISYFLVDDISVQVTAPAPANDSCGGAIPMTVGTTYTLNTTVAATAGDPIPGCDASFGKGVWYAFTPSASGAVTINTCGSDFDTVLTAYIGSCGGLTAIACNDDDGPACSGLQASVSFAGVAGVTYFLMAGGSAGAGGNLSIQAISSGVGALKIIPSFDSSITNDPQAATIEATINSAIEVFQNSYSDPITVTITFQKMPGGVGANSTYYRDVPYSSYRAALVTHATSSDDATALAHLSVAANNPVNGNPNMSLSLPLARALGFRADPLPGEDDSIIYLNISNMNLSSSGIDTNKYSLFAAVSHEINEVLGFASALDGLTNGAAAPTGPLPPGDLFRYDAFGSRSFTTDVNAASYFSLDGTIALARYNQYAGGDFQDWYSYYGGQTPQVQDAFGTPGSMPVLGVELRVLDVIGYTRKITVGLPTLSLARAGANLTITWPTNFPGFTLQSATNVTASLTWSNVSPAPSILNGQYTYTVTNPVSLGSRNFYRLVK